MQLWFSRRHAAGAGKRKSRRPASKRRRLALDCLEDRRLLSAGTLNTTSPEAFTVPGTAPIPVTATSSIVPVIGSPHSVAMDSNGDTVVVWADTSGSTAYSLYFELYSKTGTGTSAMLNPVAGGALETTSSTPITNNGGFPVVAVAPTSGEFAVGWNASDHLLSRSNSAYLQLYNFSISADGTTGSASPVGNEIVVGKTNAAYMRQIAMNDQGFDVLYGVPDGSWAGFSDPNVQRYSSTGAQLGGPIAVAKLPGQYSNSSLAMDPNSNFVVGWGDSIYQKQAKDYENTLNWQRYDSNGNTYGAIAPVVLNTSTTALNGYEGVNLAMDANDDFVTAYSPNGKGLYTIEDGIASTIREVDSAAQVSYDWASISMQPATGTYALSWVDSEIGVNPTTGRSYGYWNVMADTFDLSGNELQSPIVVYSTASLSTPGIQQAGSAAIDSGGDVVVVYGADEFNTRTGEWDTDGGLFGTFYQDPPAPTTSAPTASSPTGLAGPAGSTTAATDAVFAAYAYPEDDDTQG